VSSTRDERIRAWALLVVLASLGSGCAGGASPEDGGVGPGAVARIPREALDGEWWYAPSFATTGARPTALGPGAITAPFTGAMGLPDPSVEAPVLARVRLVEEGETLALRASSADRSLGETLASFAIVDRSSTELHVDFTRVTVSSSGLFPERLEATAGVLRFAREVVGAGDRLELRPTVARVGEDPRELAVWPPGSEERVSYLSGASLERWTCERGCEPFEVVRRHVLWRIPPEPRYAADAWYEDDQRRFPLSFVSRDGLSLRARRELFGRSLSERACTSSADCAGSRCDPVAGRCAIPLAERAPARVAYRLEHDYPPHLVRGAFEAVAQWNEALMAGHRAIRGVAPPTGGSPVRCQRDDPTAYCFCGAAEVGADDTCAARTDWFVRPEARGEERPYACWIEGPADLVHPRSVDEYGEAFRAMRFVGPECLLVLESSDRAIELGDLRVSLLSHVPGAPFCALAQPRLDPRTGEIVTARLHTGGGCLDELGALAAELWPVLRGERSEAELFGEPSFDGYYERIARTAELPPTPGPPPPPRPSPLTLREPARPRVPAPPAIDLTDRAAVPLAPAAGSALEARWMEPWLDEARAHARRDDPFRPELDDASALEAFSPLRAGPVREALRLEVRDRSLVEHLAFPPRFAHYAAGPQRWWARAFAGAPEGEARVRWQQANHRAFVARLVGHGLGLAPNLAGSLDRDHYPDAWFRVALATPLPTPDAYDVDGDGILVSPELLAFRRAWREARERRLDAGLANVSSASVLDVHGDLSDLSGVGRADRAAVLYAYFDLVEAIEPATPRHVEPRSSNDGLLRSDVCSRSLLRHYAGGETCRRDDDCPFAHESALVPGQSIHQRCLAVTTEALPSACEPGDAACACSSLDDDFRDYLDGFGPDRWFEGDRTPRRSLVAYLACGPGEWRSECNLDDAGESIQALFVEQRETWRELYPFAHRLPARAPSPTARHLTTAARIHQSLWARTSGAPGFQREPGPLGFLDHYLGVIRAVDSIGELASLPDVGAYRLDLEGVALERVGEVIDEPTTIALGPGLGFAHRSSGRVLGVEWDRLAALSFLVHRELGLGDQLRSSGLADVFEPDAAFLLGAAVADDAARFGPYVALDAAGRPAIVPAHRYVGTCLSREDGTLEPCRDPGDDVVGARVSTLTPALRAWAGALSFYAASHAFAPAREPGWAPVWPLDEAAPWPHGEAVCALGEPLPGSGHPVCDDPEDAAYVIARHEGEAWIAAASPWHETASAPHAGFALLRAMNERRAVLAVLEALPAPSELDVQRMERLRSRLEADAALARELVTLARLLGAGTWAPAPSSQG
jgi:hypothetical protein